MRKLFSILAVSGLALAPVAQVQAQDDAAVFKPAGPWALDYGDDYCRLGRVFSNGSQQLELGIERIRPGAQLRIVIVGDAIKAFRGATDTGYTFLPAQTERTVRPLRAKRGDVEFMTLPEVTLTPFVPPARGAPPAPPPKYDRVAEAAVAKGITAIGLGKGLTHPVRFETGPLDAPIAALQTCADDLVKSWGLDPEKNKTLSSPAVPQAFPWLPAGTVGFTDFAKLAGNTNQVRLLIDANGKPTKCAIAWATLDKVLNDKICATLMQKASFTPAKDASGQPVASYWMGSPMFLMPVPAGGPGRGGPSGGATPGADAATSGGAG